MRFWISRKRFVKLQQNCSLHDYEKYIALAVIPRLELPLFMKRLHSYIIVGVGMFALGVLLSTMLFSRFIGRPAEVLMQTDTVYVHDTLRFGKEDIKTELDKSKKPRVEYVYVELPQEVVETIVHDTTYIVKEVPLRKEHYYSEVDDVRIWHSGVSSAIDSVENVRHTQLVTNKVAKDIKHSIGVYANMGYSNGLSTPVGVRYTYHAKRWLGVGVRAERDFAKDQVNVMGTLELSFGW